MPNNTHVKVIGLAPNDSRCDCERSGCHAGDCAREASFLVEAFDTKQRICPPCLAVSRSCRRACCEDDRLEHEAAELEAQAETDRQDAICRWARRYDELNGAPESDEDR